MAGREKKVFAGEKSVLLLQGSLRQGGLAVELEPWKRPCSATQDPSGRARMLLDTSSGTAFILPKQLT